MKGAKQLSEPMPTFCQLDTMNFKFMIFQNSVQNNVHQMIIILFRDQYVNVGPCIGITVS